MFFNYLFACLLISPLKDHKKLKSSMQVDFIEKHAYTRKTVPAVQLDSRGEEIYDIKMNEWRIKTWVCWQLWLLFFPVSDMVNFEILAKWCKWVNPLDTKGVNPLDKNYWPSLGLSLDPAAHILPLRRSLEYMGQLMLQTEQKGLPENSVWPCPLCSK